MKRIFQIVDRLKKLKGYKTDGEVASALKTTKTALCNHKARDTIPYEVIVSFCERKSISLDWLLTGEGPKHRGDTSPHENQAFTASGQEEVLLELFRGLSSVHKLDVIGFTGERRLAETTPRRKSKKVTAA